MRGGQGKGGGSGSGGGRDIGRGQGGGGRGVGPGGGSAGPGGECVCSLMRGHSTTPAGGPLHAAEMPEMRDNDAEKVIFYSPFFMTDTR